MSEDNVVRLKLVDGVGPGAKIRPNRVLAGARTAGLTDVVVLGFTEDGALFASSSHGAADTLWLSESAKAWLVAGGPED